MPINPITRKLADEFKLCVRKALTDEKLKAVDATNKLRADATCATHDYFDANCAMMEAFKRLEMELDVLDVGMTDEEVQLWNDAWGIAKEEGFAS